MDQTEEYAQKGEKKREGKGEGRERKG